MRNLLTSLTIFATRKHRYRSAVISSRITPSGFNVIIKRNYKLFLLSLQRCVSSFVIEQSLYICIFVFTRAYSYALNDYIKLCL